jgi:hypothetical protein
MVRGLAGFAGICRRTGGGVVGQVAVEGSRVEPVVVEFGRWVCDAGLVVDGVAARIFGHRLRA